MVLINEWLPNPAGRDTEGEWVELWNGDQQPANLQGWVLANGSEKKFSLDGRTISAGGHLLIKRPELKLSLRNSGERLSLYNAQGELVDRSEYKGVAQEGKSLARRSASEGGVSGTSAGKFLFAEPTPGAANTFQHAALAAENIPVGVPFGDATLGVPEVIGLALGVGALFTVAIFFLLKRNEGIYKLLFGGDKTVR